MNTKEFFNIITSANTTEIRLYGSIGGSFRNGITSKEFANEFKKYDVIGKEINLRINSTGGEIFDGIAIFNTIHQSKANVSIYIDGIAASMASVIALAGKKIYMSSRARFMTHRATGGISGNAEDMKNYAIQLEELENIMASIYAQKTGLTVEAAKAKYLQTGLDRWISAKEALDEKLIDGIYDLNTATPPTNELVPVNLWNFFNKHLQKKDTTFMREQLIEILGCEANATDTAIINAVTALTNVKNTAFAKVTATIDLAKNKGIIDAEKQELYKMVAKENPQFVIDTLIDVAMTKQQAVPVSIASMIDAYNSTGLKSKEQKETNEVKPKSQWGLDDYRKYSPNELITNDNLYNELLKKEGLVE